jgi:uncharacterized surface protein with fasciclin (FAS1) repeats
LSYAVLSSPLPISSNFINDIKVINMKFITTLLPLAAITSAFVVPDEQMTNQIVLESQKEASFFDKLQDNVEQLWEGVEESFKNAVAFSENALDNAFNAANDAVEQAKDTFECHASMSKFDVAGWLDTELETPDGIDVFERPKDPHHKPPHHRHPHHGHKGHHHKSNKTIYQLISSSKYTTKLAKLIDEYPDLVETLNGTAANYTLFAPTDKAFEKLPKGHKKPSKELIKKVLAYHVSPEFYPAGRIVVTHTIPTALGEDSLGGEPQRLRVGLGLFKGLNINFYSKIVAVNIVRPSLSSTTTSNKNTVRSKRRDPRRRLHHPASTPSNNNHLAPSGPIQHAAARSREDGSVRSHQDLSPRRRNALRALEFRIQETRPENQCIPVLQIRREISQSAPEIPRRCQPNFVL